MVIDLLLLLIFAAGFFIGFSRGIIQTVFGILSFVFGFVVAVKFAPTVAEFLTIISGNPSPLMSFVGFIVAFILTMMVIRLVAKGFEGILQTANINFINQIAGGALVGAFLTLLYSGLLWFGNEANLITTATKEQSKTYAFLETYPMRSMAAIRKITPAFSQFWDRSIDMMDDLKKTKVETTSSDPNIFDIPDEDRPEENNPVENSSNEALPDRSNTFDN